MEVNKESLPRLRLARGEILFLTALLLSATLVRLPAIFGRAIWYDEAITLFETAGHGLPVWPKRPTPAGVVKQQLRGSPSLGDVAEQVRSTDVHPPLHHSLLSLWRRAFGNSIETARLLSLLFVLGAIVAFYLLLRFAGPLIARIGAGVYALLPGSLVTSVDARPYALASFLLLMAALGAYLARAEPDPGSTRAAAAGAMMAVGCGLAFHANYLSVFTAATILAWYFWNTWRRSKGAAIAFPLLALVIAAMVLPFAWHHLSARPGQAAGFRGLTELKSVVTMILAATFLPDPSRSLPSYGITAGILGLLGFAGYLLLRRFRNGNRRLWILLLALAATPVAGVLLLDLAFNKHLMEPRYLSFTAPAVAALVAYPIALLPGRWRVAGTSLFAAFLGLQIARVHVKTASDPDFRKLARTIRNLWTNPQLVVLDEGWGRGIPGSAVYELDADVPVISLRTPREELFSRIQSYPSVWLVFSFDQVSAKAREELQNRLAEAGTHRVVFRELWATQLRRLPPRDAQR
jgi:hypothetical protein